MKALLVIDVQKGLTVKYQLYQEDLFFKKVNEIIYQFRKDNLPVIFIQHNNKFLLHDTPDWEIDDRIDYSFLDLTIQKMHGDAFRATDLKMTLQQRGINQVYICGIASHACIKYTCLGCIANGFECFLIHDAHTCWNRNAEELIQQTEIALMEMGINIICVRKEKSH
jgi:nicotinamidase-related amidase